VLQFRSPTLSPMRPPSDADIAQAHRMAEELAGLIAEAKTRLADLTAEAVAAENGEMSARAVLILRRQTSDCQREIASLQAMAQRLRMRFPAPIA
jgi:hypothetical protein